MIVLPVWKELLQWGPLLLGGAAMGSTVERVLGPCRSWPRRGALYLLLGFTLGLPAWVGDHNPILLFLPFLTVFLLCGGGRPQARLVAGGIFYTLLVPIGMMADTVLKQAINSVSHNGERVGSNLVKLVCWAVLVPVIWKLVRRPVRLSSRLWKLLGGLTLAPLMATLSFSLWGTGMVGDELVDHFVEGIAYTILPFASLSALALLAALAVLSRHEELEEENRLAGLREVYYQGLRQEQAQVRALRHDMRNHLSALLGLLERGSWEEAERYLRQLGGSPALTGHRRFCGNETVDVVLASKAAALEEAGLTGEFQVSLPEQMDIPAPELCALLGNALDNAIDGGSGGGGPDGAAEGPGGQGAADAAGGECLGTSRKAGTGRSLCDNEGGAGGPRLWPGGDGRDRPPPGRLPGGKGGGRALPTDGLPAPGWGKLSLWGQRRQKAGTEQAPRRRGAGGLAICLVRFRTLLGPNDAGRRCRSPERRRP